VNGKSEPAERYGVGVDFGGTNIEIALVDGAGSIAQRARVETRAETGPDSIIERMAACVVGLVKAGDAAREGIVGVGIGSPGPLTIADGVIRGTPNLPGWDEIYLRDRIASAVGLRTWLENDANAAAYGEFCFGAGREVQSMIILTLGTGVGGGVILDGRIWHGCSDVAGHLGHITLYPEGRPCGCGKRGCLEAYASATALARRAREIVIEGRETLITSLADGAPSKITSKTIYDAAVQGDEVAVELFRGLGHDLGVVIGSLLNAINVEMAVITGGMLAAREFFFPTLIETARENSFEAAFGAARIVPSELGGDAGVVGAAALALDGRQPYSKPAVDNV